VFASHSLLLDYLRGEIRHKQQNGMMLAVLAINLDCVSRVDGLLGYAAGDALLEQITARLKAGLRPTDVLGVLGRDELGCVLPEIAGEGYALLATHKILRVLEQAFTVSEQQVLVSASLGIALYPEHGKSAETLLRQANLTMHEAKRSRIGFMVYTSKLEQMSQLQFEIKADLVRAIRDNEFYLYYQPQLDLATERITGYEALLRWDRSPDAEIPTATIITVAENSGLISSLTEGVLNTALRQYINFQRTGMDVDVSINFSARNLVERELSVIVEQALKTWSVPPGKIVVEITESAMIEDEKKCLETLKKLKDIGVKLSIDDFGTGYASMSYLRKLPVDELKIDISFVRNMMKVKQDERIVRSVITLSHNFDLEVVAEGVEDEATLEHLRDLGCDKVQGSYISPPLPEAAAIKIFSSYGT
jgi:diguanylate cyclase (GGDEF)-like protein